MRSVSKFSFFQNSDMKFVHLRCSRSDPHDDVVWAISRRHGKSYGDTLVVTGGNNSLCTRITKKIGLVMLVK